MRALHIKLWRDLVSLKAQVATIALVVACGVSGFVGAFSTHASLQASRDAYYRDARFADVFAAVRRAPLSLRQRLLAIPGVAEVETTTAFDTQLDLPGVVQPLTGRIVALDLAHPSVLNRLTVLSGRWPERSSEVQALVSERFAHLRGLVPGSTVTALLNGRRERLHIVGTVASPEYVFASRGQGPDDEWFGVLWIDAERVASAFGMDGAFNRASLTLMRGAHAKAVIAETDRILERYGSVGAIGRDRQLSAAVVDNELRQQKVLGTALPVIFLAVAAFILNVVLSRQVATQRGQIAALKALGYRNTEIAGHYVLLAIAMAAVGTLLGLAGSQALGSGMVSMYADVFRFDQLQYRMVPWTAVAAAGAVALAAAIGALAAIRSVVMLSPAQAMLPALPPNVRRTLMERLRSGRRVAPAALMVLRNVERRPVRAALTVLGIACAVALQICGLFWQDVIERIVHVQYGQVQPGDVLVSFAQPVAPRAAADLARLPGVLEAEVWRVEPVRIRVGEKVVDTVLSGRGARGRLLRVVDAGRGPVAMPLQGVVITALLARELGVERGDLVDVEFRLWHRRTARLPVSDVVEALFGRVAWMSIGAMNRAAADGEGVTDGALRIDPNASEAFYAAIKQTPVVSAVFDKAGSLRSFEKTTARNIGWFTGVLSLFAVAMAIGITYNAARIALSERAWELASLRVLGMTRAEVARLLFAELGLEGALALPLGMLLGTALAGALMRAMESDEIAFPLVIEPSTYGLAALTVVVAGVVSAGLVRRRMDRLDLVSALKVRE